MQMELLSICLKIANQKSSMERKKQGLVEEASELAKLSRLAV